MVGLDGRTTRWRGRAVVLAASMLVAATPGTGVAASGPQAVSAAPPGDVLTSGGEPLGTVSTQALAVVPLVGNTALPVKFAATGAQADGKVRRASSSVTDLGLLGTLGMLAITGAPTLTRLGIPASQFTGALKLPASSVADSRGTADAEARPVVPAVPIGPVTLGGGHQEAHADEAANAVARTELGDATLDLGIVTVELNGGVAEAVADATHVAATTSLGELRFLSGGAEIGALRGLVWRFEHVLDRPATASFVLGSGRLGAVEYPLTAQGARGAAAALTAALAPLGVRLTMPAPLPEGGLSPLRLVLQDSPAAARFVRPLYSALLADAVNQAEGAIVGGAPEAGLALTVVNVVLAALTGKGGAALELGGVTGSMTRRPVETFVYGGDADSPARPSAVAGAVTSAPAITPSPSRTAANVPAPKLASANERASLSQLVAVVADDAVPPLLVVLAGLGAALAMAAVDRRRISALIDQGGSA